LTTEQSWRIWIRRLNKLPPCTRGFIDFVPSDHVRECPGDFPKSWMPPLLDEKVQRPWLYHSEAALRKDLRMRVPKKQVEQDENGSDEQSLTVLEF